MPIELLTDAGAAKIAAAAGNNTEVAITHIALGDGNGTPYDPVGTETALVNERVRQPIVYRELIDTSTWRAKAEFPPETPNFVVRELGFFDADGDLIAIRAGVDLNEGETGYVTYLVQHDINFSNVADGAVIVYVPNPDGEAMMTDFLNDKQTEFTTALNTHQANFDALETQYNGLTNDLAAIVAAEMERKIQWLPNAPDTNNVNGGHVRNWGEIIAFMNTCPPGSYVTIELDDGDHEFTAGTPAHLPFLTRLVFKGIGNTTAGSRPRITMTPTDAGNINAMPFLSPVDARLAFTDCDIHMGPEAVPGAGFHTGNMWLRLRGATDIELTRVKIMGDAPHFARVYDGGNIRANLTTVEVEDGITAFLGDGTLALSTLAVTLNGSAVLHSGFTLGTDLLEA